MKLLIPHKNIELAADGTKMNFRGGFKYVLSNMLANNIMTSSNWGQMVRFEDFVNTKVPTDNADYTGKTILVSRTGGRGDFFFILRSVLEIKSKFKDVKLKFACGPRFISMLRLFPNVVDESRLLPFSIKEYESSDYFVTFEGYIEKNPKAAEVNAFELTAEHFKIPLSLPYTLPMVIPEFEVKAAQKIYEEWNTTKPIIGIQPKASATLRTYPYPLLAQLVRMLQDKGYEVLFLDRIENINAITSLPEFAGINVLAPYKGTGSFELSVAVAKYCKLIICPDSVFTYVGDSLGIPVIALYSPFSSSLRAKGLDVHAVECPPPGCYNCCIHSSWPCVRSKDGWSPCLKKIDPRLLAELAFKILDEDLDGEIQKDENV